MSQENKTQVHPLNRVISDVQSLQVSLIRLTQYMRVEEEKGEQFLDAMHAETRVLGFALEQYIRGYAQVTDTHEELGVPQRYDEYQRLGYIVEDESYQEDGYQTQLDVMNLVLDLGEEARTRPERSSSILRKVVAEVDPCSDTAHPDYDADYCRDSSDAIDGEIIG
jgi:hypothetical protein